MPNITIYVPQFIEDHLKHEENKSGLVSRLLANYYAGKPIKTTELVTSPEKKQKFEELKTKYPPLEIKTDFSSDIESHGMAEIAIPGMREQTIAPPEFGA